MLWSSASASYEVIHAYAYLFGTSYNSLKVDKRSIPGLDEMSGPTHTYHHFSHWQEILYLHANLGSSAFSHSKSLSSQHFLKT